MRQAKFVFVFLVLFCHAAYCNAAPLHQDEISKQDNRPLIRISGYKLCNHGPNDPEGTLLNFFYFPTAVPNEECIYLIMKESIPLTASQVTPDGVLVGASWSPINRFIFLYNDNKIDADLVDGAAIQPGYFVYVGNLSYTSITGPRKVYAFRRVENPFAKAAIKQAVPDSINSGAKRAPDSRPLILNGDHIDKGGHFLGAYIGCIGNPAEPQRYSPYVDWLGHSHPSGHIGVSDLQDDPEKGGIKIGEPFLYLWTICRAPAEAFMDECKAGGYLVSQCHAALMGQTNEFLARLATYPPKTDVDPREFTAPQGGKTYMIAKTVCGRKAGGVMGTYTNCTDQPAIKSADSYIHCWEDIVAQVKRDMSASEEIEKKKNDPAYDVAYSCKAY